jgi:hypothetical protein
MTTTAASGSASAPASAAALDTAAAASSKVYELCGTELNFALPNMGGVFEDIDKAHLFIRNATVLDTKCWNWVFIFADFPRTSRMLRNELSTQEEPLYLSRVATLEEQAVLRALFVEDIVARFDAIRKLVTSPKRVCGVVLDATLTPTACVDTVRNLLESAERGRDANEERIRALSQEIVIAERRGEGGGADQERSKRAMTQWLVAARNNEEAIGWQIEDLNTALRQASRVEAVWRVLEEEAGGVVARAKALAADDMIPDYYYYCRRMYFRGDDAVDAAAANALVFAEEDELLEAAMTTTTFSTHDKKRQRISALF